MGLEWRNKWRRKYELRQKFYPEKKILILDVETTGITEKSKIIQFSGVLCKINKSYMLDEVDSLDMYVNPGEHIEDKIVEITGISDETVRDADTEKEAMPMILQLFQQADVVAGYNISFDLMQLENMMKRNMDQLPMKPFIDVCELARDFVKRGDMPDMKLATVAKKLLPERKFIFHDSMEDVKATMAILEALVMKYRELADETDKQPVHLERAHLFINPRKQSMQRIYTQLSIGGDGDIFYDIPGHFWSCKSTTMAKKMFQNVDMLSLENQMYNKYMSPFGYKDMDELARSWMKYRRDKQRERKANTVQA